MARLEISLFGSFQAILDGLPILAFESDKARALLAFLVVEAARPQRRETLAALLWPDQPEASARNNLRQTLFRLRKAIAERDAASPHLLVSAGEVQFNLSSDFWLDVAEFERRLADCRAHHPQRLALCPDCLKRLKAAVALFQGDFLGGFSIPDSAPFDSWVLAKQEEYHHVALEALADLATYHEQRGEYALASRYAQKAIDLEPWSEQSHRQRMRSLALQGQRVAALRQYKLCKQTLAEQLGVEPGLATTLLYEQIRDGKLFQGSSNGERTARLHISTPPSSSPPAPFAGRQDELARLDSYLEASLDGRGRVLFVTGEAGSGKTTLLKEFARLAMKNHGDLLVVEGSCKAQGGYGDAYLPFLEALQMLSGDIESRLVGGCITEEHALRLRSALADVVEVVLEAAPDLVGTFLPKQSLARSLSSIGTVWQAPLEARPAPAAQLPDAAPAASPSMYLTSETVVTNQASWGHAALFDQFAQMLQILSYRHPLVLVLDDLQWADSGSLNLLFHLARQAISGRWVGSRILVVGACRTELVTPVLHSVINELQSCVGEALFDLSDADGQEFVQAFLDSQPNRLGEAFRQTLLHVAGGNPLFSGEVMRSLQTHGGLVQDNEGYWVEGAELDWEYLPPRAAAAIAERLGRLSPSCRKLLEAASVQGESFIAEVLARVLGTSGNDVVRCLSGELSKQHHLVRAESVQLLGGQTISYYCFQQPLFQKFLYQSLDEVERAHLQAATESALGASYRVQAGESLKDRV